MTREPEDRSPRQPAPLTNRLSRAERQKAALKANLARRKAQARARTHSGDHDDRQKNED